MEEELINSTLRFNGRLIKVAVDEVRTPEGNTATREVVIHKGAVAVLPIVDNKVILVKQYRHPVRETLWEIPAGVFKEGETPEECAVRELREETGLSPMNLIKLGEIFVSPGYSTEKIYLFYADRFVPSPLPKDKDEFIELGEFALDTFREMIEEGEIKDSKTLSAFCLYLLKR
ncbi:NUDIX hydrolase [bacterium]|nr:NUDIX hydrolase [bacterium]